MKPTFEKTVDILVKAYLNDTLEHGICSACAVGNIVAAASGYSFDISSWRVFPAWIEAHPEWDKVFVTDSDRGTQNIREEQYCGLAKLQIDSTGYTWQQLARVEYAFEMADHGAHEDDYMFNGLMAVVDVLADIHGINLEQKEQAKALFVK